jgi:hypothetical protein
MEDEPQGKCAFDTTSLLEGYIFTVGRIYIHYREDDNSPD